MPPTLARSTLLAAALLLMAPPPTEAEIYRWRDADGKEHFTSDIHRVPAAHRRQARENAAAPSAGRVQYHSGDGPRIPEPAAEAQAEASPPAKVKTSGFDCEALKKQARKKLEELAKRERAVERREDVSSDIASSIYAEKRNENALRKARAALEKAQANYERWRKIQYSRGAPPGCLR
ncbi:MAG: DUF4124 domain-containing protein [Myxococcota bacterium]|nr:DUF4124 domain-containing protein [Myxococcota bacterium]